MQAPESVNGALSIYVKDDLSAWSHVNITFSEVQVRSADDNGSWMTLPIKTDTVDLITLSNVSELLASGYILTGSYTQIRILFISVTGVMANGTNVQFSMLSSELRTTHQFNVTAEASSRLTLEVDLDRSMVQTGNGEWFFTPVLGRISGA